MRPGPILCNIAVLLERGRHRRQVAGQDGRGQAAGFRRVERLEPQLQGRRIGLQPEIVVLRIDKPRIGDQRVPVLAALLLPLFQRQPAGDRDRLACRVDVQVVIQPEVVVFPVRAQQRTVFDPLHDVPFEEERHLVFGAGTL